MISPADTEVAYPTEELAEDASNLLRFRREVEASAKGKGFWSDIVDVVVPGMSIVLGVQAVLSLFAVTLLFIMRYSLPWRIFEQQLLVLAPGNSSNSTNLTAIEEPSFRQPHLPIFAAKLVCNFMFSTTLCSIVFLDPRNDFCEHFSNHMPRQVCLLSIFAGIEYAIVQSTTMTFAMEGALVLLTQFFIVMLAFLTTAQFHDLKVAAREGRDPRSFLELLFRLRYNGGFAAMILAQLFCYTYLFGVFALYNQAQNNVERLLVYLGSLMLVKTGGEKAMKTLCRC